MADVPQIPFAQPQIPTRPVNTTNRSIASSIDVIGRAAIRAGVSKLESNVTKELADVHLETAQAQESLTDDVIAEATGFGFNEEGLSSVENEQLRSLLRAQGRFRLQLEQGIINQHEFNLRAEDILRQHINRNPKLASNFIAAAQRELGFNPIATNAQGGVLARGGRGGRTTPFDDAVEQVIRMGDAIGIASDLLARDAGEYFNRVFEASAAFETRNRLAKLATLNNTIAVQDKRVAARQSFNIIRDSALASVKLTGQLSVVEVSNAVGIDLASLTSLTAEQLNDLWTEDNIQIATSALDQLELDILAEFSEMRGQHLSDEEFDNAIEPAMVQIRYFKSLLSRDDALKSMQAFQQATILGLTANEDFQRIKLITDMARGLDPSIQGRVLNEDITAQVLVPFLREFAELGPITSGGKGAPDLSNSLPDPIEEPELYLKGTNKRIFDQLRNVFLDSRATGGNPEADIIAATAAMSYMTSQAQNMSKVIRNRGQRVSEPVFNSFLDIVSSPGWSEIVDFIDDASTATVDIGGVNKEDLQLAAQVYKTDIPTYLAVEIREHQQEISNTIESRTSLAAGREDQPEIEKVIFTVDLRGLQANKVSFTATQAQGTQPFPLNVNKQLITLAKLVNAMISTTSNSKARDDLEVRERLFRALLDEASSLPVVYIGGTIKETEDGA